MESLAYIQVATRQESSSDRAVTAPVSSHVKSGPLWVAIAIFCLITAGGFTRVVSAFSPVNVTTEIQK
jgi:hypothetical protein